MAVETLRPDSAGDTTDWPSVAGMSHYAALSDDSDSTYIRNNTSTDREDSFNLDPSVLSGESISSVDIRFRARSETAANGEVQVGLRLNGVDSMAANQTSIPITATNYTKSGVSRPGSGSWQPSDLGNLQVVIIGSNGGSNAVRVFEVFVDINYSSGGAQALTLPVIASSSVLNAPAVVAAGSLLLPVIDSATTLNSLQVALSSGDLPNNLWTQTDTPTSRWNNETVPSDTWQPRY